MLIRQLVKGTEGIRQTSSKPMVLLLLEAFDRKCPRGRLVLVLLGELMDIRAVPVPLLPVGGGGCTDRAVCRTFRGSVLAILLSAQGAKSGLLLVITRARRRKIVRRELPKSEVKRRTRAEVKSEPKRWYTLVRHRKNSPDCLDCAWGCNLLHITEQCG